MKKFNGAYVAIGVGIGAAIGLALATAVSRKGDDGG